jgi:anti-sigma factor RsiW
MPYNNLTKYDVQALVDDELPWEEAKIVKQELENNAELTEYYEQLRYQKKLLQNWWSQSKN